MDVVIDADGHVLEPPDVWARYLDPASLESPALALGQATREILHMADHVRGMLRDAHRAFSDGDFVILHVQNQREPNTRGFAIIDIFRLEQRKIVEHWDGATRQ